MSTAAKLSMLLVIRVTHAYIDVVLKSINNQTVADALELIILTENEDVWKKIDLSLVENVGSVRCLETGPIDVSETAILMIIRSLNTPYAAILEDHASYSPDWAEAVIEAHEKGNWDVVGARMINANPDTFWSWSNLIFSYGPWSYSNVFGEVPDLMRHNVSYRLNTLLKYDDAILKREFRRAGRFHKRLAADGATFYLTSRGYTTHINPSLASVSLNLRIKYGQLHAAMQTLRHQWKFPVRLLLVLGTPVLPLVRFFRRYPHVFGDGRFRYQSFKMLSAYILGLLLEAAGNALGYLFGKGNSEEWLANHESNLHAEVTPEDHKKLFEPQVTNSL